MGKMKIIVVLMIVSLVAGCTGDQSESSAKNDLETYLGHMKKGQIEDSEIYLEKDVDNLIDVFNYEYLELIDEDEEEIKYSITKREYKEDKTLTDEYGDYENYVKHIKDLYKNDKQYKIEEETRPYSITWYKIGETKKIYTFLYDMEIANGAGNKLYKKIEFTLDWADRRWNGEDYEQGFIITDIDIRGSVD
jgi:hypothetical protein